MSDDFQAKQVEKDLSAQPSDNANLNTWIGQQQQQFASGGGVPDYAALSDFLASETAKGYNVTPAMPRAGEDMTKFPEEPYGKPPEWDYTTALQGMNGEELPPGAVGWLPSGKAWYGTDNALFEWAKGFSNNITTAPTETSAELKRQAIEKSAAAWDSLIDKRDVGGFLSNAFGAFVSDVQSLGATGEEEGDTDFTATVKNAFGTASRVLGQTLVGLGTGIGLAAEGVESGLAVVEDLAAESDIAAIEDTPLAFLDAIGPGLSARLGKQRAQEALASDSRLVQNIAKGGLIVSGIMERITPFGALWDLARAGVGAFKGDFTFQDVRDSANAGRILYTSFIDPTVKAEYLNRVRAGANPYLLAEELGNPIAEAFGEMILDPFNVVGWAGKNKVFNGRVSNKKEWLATPFVEARGAIAKNAEGLVQVGDDVLLAQGVAKASKRVRAKLTNLAGDVGLTQLSAQGKRNFIEGTVGELLGSVVNAYKNTRGFQPDEISEVVRAIALMSSDNFDEVHEATTILGSLKGLSPNMLFSEATMHTSVALNNVLDEFGGGAGLIDALKSVETVEDYMQVIEPKLSKAAAGMFPTLEQKAAELAQAGERLQGWEGALLNFERFANHPAMKGANNFFAHVYMGMSPGYAFRNVITNATHLFFDQGLGTAANSLVRSLSPEAGLAKIEKIQGFTQDFLRAGKGPAAAAAGVVVKGEPQTILGKGWKALTKGGLIAGARGEQGASIASYSHALTQSLDKLIQQGKAIPRADILRQANLGDDFIESLTSLIRADFTDLAGVRAKATDMLERKIVDVFDTLEWIDPKTASTAKQFQVYDQIAEVRNAETLDDALAIINKVFDDVDEYAANVSYEVANGIPKTGEWQQLLQETATYAENGLRGSDDIQVLYEKAIEANQKCDAQFLDVWQDLDAIIEQRGLANDPNFQAYLETRPFYEDGRAFYRVTQDQHTDLWQKVDALVKDVKKNPTAENIARAWNQLGMPGKPFVADGKKGAQAFGDLAWDGYLRPIARKRFSDARDLVSREVNALADWMQASGHIPDEQTGVLQKLASAKDSYQEAFLLDGSIVVDQQLRYATPMQADEYNAIVRLGLYNGVPTGTGKSASDGLKALEKAADLSDGMPNPLLKTINSYRDKQNLPRYSDLAEVPYTEAERALQTFRGGDYRSLPSEYLKGAIKKEVKIDVGRKSREVEDISGSEIFQTLFAKAAERKGIDPSEMRIKPADMPPVPAPHLDGQHVTPARVYHQSSAALQDLRRVLTEGVTENFGQTKAIAADQNAFEAINQYMDIVDQRVTESVGIASSVATEYRNFALIDYGARRNFDTILGTVFPYQFWHGRTYANWAQRIGRNPALISGYQRYKDAMSKIHAGAPEWWKYNINSNELLGLDSENPVYFNLEATLNPLNGLTGVDFEDKQKVTNWWTAALDGINRFGPASNPLLSIATAFALYQQGEEEAAARWGGRLLPISQTIMSIDAAIGDDPVNDLDPFTDFFSGGIDPYTRRRVGRSLGQMIEEGLITQEQALDAARIQEGDVWNAAHERAVSQRAPGQLASFFLGAGFKARSTSDIAIDQMYSDYFRLMENSENLSSEEFRTAMAEMQKRYDFMDTILTSSKGSDERDTAFSYSVLNRLPPGGTELLKTAGLPSELIGKFYDSRGDIGSWDESDRNRFVSAIVDVAAVIATPNDATRDEWTVARNQYGALRDAMEHLFGQDIHQEIDAFYAARLEGNQDQFLAQNPQVGGALDYKAAYIASDPQSILATYYGGLDQLESYYRGEMYKQAEQQFGSDILDLVDSYYSLPTSSQRKAYLRDFPQIRQYWDFRDEFGVLVNQKIVELGKYFGEEKGPEFRSDIGLGSVGQEAVFGALQGGGPDDFTIQDWISELGPQGIEIALGALQGELGRTERGFLDGVARDLGIDRDRLIQLVGIAAQQQ